MSTVREARPRHQSLLPRGSVGRSPSEMQQRGSERGPTVALKTCRSQGRNGKRIEFPWQPELPVIASWRQKPSAKFDISILKYRDITIILTAQIATLVIGSQRSTEPRCPCRLDEAARLRRKAASPWRRENEPLRGNDDAPLLNLIPKTCVRIAHRTTAAILHPMWTHTWAGTSSPLLFVDSFGFSPS